ncbi:hypothetical protein [Oryza sativa Japonica Group]|uniref:Os01g0140601 protein n=2 Tax=Oryza sativa subsp. japonica TaxID=39947 RepID=Q5ZDI3_ORYSJ|nr:hypothetical protein [Oryza sativa Japonica Group]BAS70314.1 Os01g0140601 [Oryza sativa Japonica Group]
MEIELLDLTHHRFCGSALGLEILDTPNVQTISWIIPKQIQSASRASTSIPYRLHRFFTDVVESSLSMQLDIGGAGRLSMPLLMSFHFGRVGLDVFSSTSTFVAANSDLSQKRWWEQELQQHQMAEYM